MAMKRLIFLALLLPFVASAQTVQNPSFESAVTFAGSNAGGSWSTSIPGWSGGGVWQPAAGEFTSIPDGTQVAYLNGGSASQTIQLASTGTVTLTVQQGNRNDGYGASATCTASLLSGTTVLGTASQPNSAIAKGAWAPLTVTASAPVGPLTITLAASTSQCDFDNVTWTNLSPPVLDSIKLATQVLVCASACNGTDDTPETGTLIVAQQKLTQSIGFNSDGTLSAPFGIDTSVDPADFTISLSDATGSLEYKIPQAVLAGQMTLGTLSLPPMRIQKTSNGIVFKGFVTP